MKRGDSRKESLLMRETIEKPNPSVIGTFCAASGMGS
jgi:hypothetical protein